MAAWVTRALEAAICGAAKEKKFVSEAGGAVGGGNDSNGGSFICFWTSALARAGKGWKG